MKIFAPSVWWILRTMSLVLAGTFPLAQLLAQEGGQQVEAGTATLGPSQPSLKKGERRPPEPTPEELKRLEKQVEEGTFLPGPSLPGPEPSDLGPPGPETTPDDACPHSSQNSHPLINSLDL